MITTILVAPVRRLHSTIVSAFSISTHTADRPDPVPKRRFINTLATAITAPLLVACVVLLGSTIAVATAVTLAVIIATTYIAVNYDVGAARLNSMLGKIRAVDKDRVANNYFTIGITMTVATITAASVLGIPITVLSVAAVAISPALAIAWLSTTGGPAVHDKKWLKISVESDRDVGNTFNSMSRRHMDRRRLSTFGLSAAT